ncbi:MAG TPA: DUF748 domain-containing protein, partial [Woeseiaceae bacterium]
MNRTLLTLAVLALAGGALYALVGFFFAPHLVERKLEAIGQGAALTVAIEATKVNPFTLTLSLDEVTLFRRENPPLVRIGKVDARIRAVRLSQRALILRDVVFRALEIADIRHQEPFLTVPSITTEDLVFESSTGALSAETARLDRPRFHLQRGADGTLNLPLELTSLLPQPAAGSTRFEISDGSLEFTDRSMPAAVRLNIEDLDGTIVRRTTGRETATAIALMGRMSDTATGEITAEWFPSRGRNAARVEVSLHDMDMAALSPYIAAVIGRHIRAGRMDLTMQLLFEESELDLTNWLVIGNLQLGGSIDDGRAPNLPLDLAVALLEDRNGEIATRVPVARRFLDSDESPVLVFENALADYIAAVAATPLERLAELAGRPDLDLSRFAFPPGSAD